MEGVFSPIKTAEEVKPNYAPCYVTAFYPGLAQICIAHGYALAVHGSLARDFDLVAVPWAQSPSAPEAVINEIVATFDVKIGENATAKAHGRIVWTLIIAFGGCFLDFSFMPRIEL